MATRRYYSAIAVDNTVSSGISSSATSVVLSSSPIGFPASYPFTVAIDYDNAAEEIVLVTNISGTTMTITRGYNGSAAVAHNAGASVRHVIVAQDLTDFQDHAALGLTGGAHGVTGALATFLGTPSSANLASLISDETGTGPVAFSQSPSLATPTISGGSVTGATLINTILTGTLTANGSTGAAGTFLSSTGTGLAWATSGGGVLSVNGVLTGPLETFNIVGTTGPTGSLNVDIKTAGVWYYTAAATANFTLNFRGDSSTTLNSILTTGQAITVSVIWSNGAGPYSPGPYPYYPTAVTVDGASVTPKWSGGVSIYSGATSGVSSVSYTIIKTASATFTILATQGEYA
jgi:hypothetical protein